VVLSNYQKLIC